MERQASITFCGIDSETPHSVPLSAKYTRSFAYHTVKDRLPVILTKIVDHLSRCKEEIKTENGENAEEDIKSVVGQISKLKNEVQTNKPLLPLDSSAEDAVVWNKYLMFLQDDEEDGPPCWFQSCWLYVENYMYRRIEEFFENTTCLKYYDPFRGQKQEALEVSMEELKAVYQTTMHALSSPVRSKDQVVQFLKMCLWGNRCDLSLTNGAQVAESDSVLSNVTQLDQFLLADDSSMVWDVLSKSPGSVIDLVHDNAAYELFTDLCLCDVLYSSGLVSKVRFHAKRIPWYVSDVTKSDVTYLLLRLHQEGLSELADRWAKYLSSGVWSLDDEIFWTTPFPYNDMEARDPVLYQTLAQSNLVIFKGDLNYRKLLGDINWPHNEPFEAALRSFRPSNVLALRTVKADLICGIDNSRSEQLTAEDALWMRTGQYGVIQLYNHQS